MSVARRRLRREGRATAAESCHYITNIPFPLNLSGTTFYTQWVVLDTATANLSVSNYGRVQIGL